MIIASIVTLAVLIGALFLHMFYTYGVMKGYERGLDDAEQIIREVRNEEVFRHRDRA